MEGGAPEGTRPPDTGTGTGTEGRTDTGTQPTAEQAPSFPQSRGPSVQPSSVAMLGAQIGTASNPGTANPPSSSFSTSTPSSSGHRSFGTVLVPAVQGSRISEDESPRPYDRVYLNFNYFDDVNDALNRRLGNTIHDIQVYRETLGVEKTCLDGNASIGLRLPLDTLRAGSLDPTLGKNSTDIGDLTAIVKYAVLNDCETGNTLCVGLAATFPTGPRTFADSNITVFHDTVLQPYAGYICNSGDFFVHGFIGFDVATDPNDVSAFFNSIGIGYHVNRCQGGDRFITDIIPTLEAHLVDPLNHRGSFRLDDLAASTDVLSLTGGVTIEFSHGCTFALGLNTPITGPKPYNFEFLAQLNWRFGPRAAGLAGGPTSMLGF
jgi:hypothetical protein